MNVNRVLNLADLHQGLLGMTSAQGQTFEEACIVCLENQKHVSGVEIQIIGMFSEKVRLQWDGKTTSQMQRTWNDEPYTTEQAAYGLAILLVVEMTDLTVIERSRKGTGFDYWLGYEQPDTDPPFQKTARLEVSGIRHGTDAEIKNRVKDKKAQTNPTDGVLPAYIIVIEFSRPLSHMEKK